MATFDAKNIRNVLILGHQSSGKTTLSEALAFTSGLITSKGEVEKKNTISDYLPEEQKRGGSIQTAIVPLTYKEHKINLIDVPGNDDFISEYIGALGAVKGAILLIDAHPLVASDKFVVLEFGMNSLVEKANKVEIQNKKNQLIK